MKRRLDLRTGTPVWSAYRSPRAAAEKLRRDVSADVLVVGLGISGAMMCEALTAAGMSVIGIDRRGPIKGSTAATTALVSFEIDQPLGRLGDKVGKTRAERAWQRSRLAVDNLRARIIQLDIDCSLTERPSVYLAGTVLDAAQLREEVQARQAAGLWCEFVTGRALKDEYGIAGDGAIVSRGNLALDPRKLCAGLLRVAARRGVRYYSPVEAVSFDKVGERLVASTKQGPSINVGAVVLATGYELMDVVPAYGHRIISTWAIATKPQPRRIWRDAAFVWQASDPYLYLRSTSDGRVICGGEDEDFSDETRRDAAMSGKADTIARKLGRLLPRIETKPQFVWTGSFGTTGTGLPIIARLPGRGSIYAVLGYGGNGITFSQIASELVGAELAGKRYSDADLFQVPK
jgi:glycine/D-amino acid oxidase-like deaminating enzyme